MNLTSTEVTLRDGARALIRPIRPDDKPRMQEAMRALSSESRYLRFHMPVDELTPEQLAYLTEIDYYDHMAWAAIDLDDPARPGMGVARYVRVADEPTIAEAAVTVVDRYQGRGLGTFLLGRLARTARENGIRVFRNYVLAENTGMLALLDQLGAERSVEAPGVYRMDMPIPEDPDDLPDTATGRVFRAVADRRVPPLRLSFPVTWFRRWTDRPQEPIVDETAAGQESPLLRDYLDETLDDADTGDDHT